jgi:nicotinate-nucleotide--dimethylbenzimidazole phosphoribosyltransferase
MSAIAIQSAKRNPNRPMNHQLLPTIPALDRTAEAEIRDLIDGLAKPKGSMGRLENLALKLALIQRTATPRAQRVLLFVFAGDHGITDEGVSSYPQAVTAAMVRTFISGRACVNACAAAAGVEMRVVDAGVAADLARSDILIDAKIRRGTRNSAHEPAMTRAEMERALEIGIGLVGRPEYATVDVVALGEMGIGNTAASALLMHRLAPAPLDACIGEGAGQDAVGMARKRAALSRAASRSDASKPLDVMAEFGGLEIAMMTGALLGAAAARKPVIVDGFISTVAALAAARLDPVATDFCIFSHRSAEHGHRILLDVLRAQPLLDLKMRLGEGSGAVLAVPLIRAASALLSNVASLKDVVEGRL